MKIIKDQPTIIGTLGISGYTHRHIYEGVCIGLQAVLDNYIVKIEDEVMEVKGVFEGGLLMTQAMIHIGRPLSSEESVLFGFILHELLKDKEGQVDYLTQKHGVVMKSSSVKMNINLNLN